MKKKAVVIDDDPLLQKLAILVLQNTGLEVVAFDNGEDALEFLKTKPVFDLVVTDFNMPGINGLAVLRFVRENFPQAKAILMSSLIRESLIQEAESLGFVFLRKGFVEEMQNLVTVLLK